MHLGQVVASLQVQETCGESADWDSDGESGVRK